MGKFSNTLAGCVEHSVRDRWRDPNQSKFADPFRTQRVDPATRDRLSGSADDNTAHGLSKAIASNRPRSKRSGSGMSLDSISVITGETLKDMRDVEYQCQAGKAWVAHIYQPERTNHNIRY